MPGRSTLILSILNDILTVILPLPIFVVGIIFCVGGYKL